jgi:amino acid adenylation domain-containing protein
MASKVNGLDRQASERYWMVQLHEAKQATFPPRRPAPVIRSLTKTITFPQSTSSSSVTKTTVLQAAWATVLARYCDTDDVCFGASVLGLESMTSTLVVPIRVRLDPEQTVADFLRDVQARDSDMTVHKQFGLQEIVKLSEDTREACNFASLLVIRTAEPVMSPTAMKGYSLVVHALLTKEKYVKFSATYDSGLLADVQVTALSHHFDRVVQQLLSPGETETQLRNISLAGPWDLQQAIATNRDIPEAVDDCVHHLIARQTQQRPDAPAICAWDGKLTYSELNAAADRLAHYLAGEVAAEVLVHVLFEKSVWFFVAILAINKAGGAWIPLDPSHPTQRHQEIVHQTKARLILVSKANAEMCNSLGLFVIEVTAALDKSLADEEARAVSQSQLPTACEVTAQNAAYVLFTSGSTGTPKGLVIDHGSLCTSQVALGASLGLATTTRFLQFASYVFDSCIGEIFATLLAGGCVCVPSDEMRWTGIPDFIRDTCANSALLTPSFIRTIKPEDVPSLRLLITASESPGQDILNAWFGRVRLFNAWGPAEICVISTLHEWKSVSESPLTVGRPVGGSCSWIVDPENHKLLTPIGCVGEIVVQGPTLLREYLSNREKTKEFIVTPVPAWMPRRYSDARWDRFFKTGDLGFYNPDRTIEFIGRKDTQVKIRGQRVELEEVEYNIRIALEGIRQVAVDVLQTMGRVSLVAYLCFSLETKRAGRDRGDNMDNLFLLLTDEVERKVRDLAKELRTKLPSYMVPTIFIPCRYMPFLTKLDRKTLRQKTTALSSDSIARYSLVDTEKHAPETPLETQMQQLWAAVLKVPVEWIGRDDNFLQIGGDSIAAIRLISLARSHGISLEITSIFEDARLWHLAAIASSTVARVALPPPPFSLLPEGYTDELLDQARRQCSLSTDQVIEDAYPCTPLQEGLMALAITQPGSYMTTWVYKLSPHVDLIRFKDAWEQTVTLCVSLRTRIILVDGGSFQIVLRDDVAWEAWESPARGELRSAVDFAVEETHKIEIITGSRLWRYALTERADGQKYFTLIGHHAVFDGWSIGLTMQRLQCLYNDTMAAALEPYSCFIQYVGGLDCKASEKYWTAQLQEAKRAAFPPRKPNIANTTAGSVLRTFTKSIALPKSASFSVTKATVLRAAWAMVLARYCDTNDVCFGASISGRHAPVPGLEAMAGPLVATIPVRLRIDAKQKVADFLLDVQAHASGMIPHEQFGLQNMIKLSKDAREACDFASVLIIQPAEILAGIHTADSIMVPAATTGMAGVYEFFGFPLVVQAYLGEKNVEFAITYDTAWMVEAQVTALYYHFDCVVQQLLAPGETLLCNVSLAGPWDLQQATAWNQEGPKAIDDSVHDLITRQAQRRPDAQAICAWDGEFKYSELDVITDRLARHLTGDHGVELEDLVHVCFEKSIWFYISIIAINKAGGAWVPLDPSYPTQRQQEIVRQTKAKLTLTSAANAKMCKGLGIPFIAVTAALNKDLGSDGAKAASQLPLVKSQHAAYVLFTSGSTGTPKGVVMEHGSVCTSMAAIKARLGLTADVRKLQFASYSFDVCVYESLLPLMYGACVCVPSDRDRLTGLEKFMNATAITWATFTPAFARTVDPNKLQNLQVLVIGGEAAGQDLLRKWIGKTRMINCWGPAETCVIGACHEYQSVNDSPQTIGRPLGGCCWIVEPDDHERLAPIGCVGEIVVQGPTVLREYLSDRKKTEAAIITVPAWMPRRTEAKYGRFYKTGDLAFYNSDGTIEFIGRKDTQVKIRGQRVELGEIEYSIQTTLEGIEQVAVDVLRTKAGAVSLVAYLCFNRETSLAGRDSGDIAINGNVANGTNDLFLPLTGELEQQVRGLAKELERKLPGYMVPTMFIPCRYMPFITTTKLDRKKLGQKTAALDKDDTARYSLVGSEKKQPPKAEREVQMQQLWASILKIPAETIGRDDSFLQIGGDSITAIRLVLLARRQGITLTVASIFEDARLSRLAAMTGQQND